MNLHRLSILLESYLRKPISTSLHPNDHMYNSNPRLEDYTSVGESAINAIISSLAVARKEAVWNILDFGCGHGRVARHLRSIFPKAHIYFSDIDPSCTEFCSKSFDGIPVQSNNDFSKLQLPENMDLIWVGSIFTHIDYSRMQVLFDRLFNSLGIGGLLIATFRGRRTYEVTLQKSSQAKLYASLIEQYRKHGVGYQSYGRKDLGDWGLSLISIDKCISLGEEYSNCRLVNFTEAGWANIHDLASFTRIDK